MRCHRLVELVIAILFIFFTLQESWGQQPLSLDIVLVLDKSGSMKQNDPYRLMGQAAKEFVKQLGEEDAAGLVVFGTQAAAVQPLAPLGTGKQRDDLLSKIEQIRYADACTNIAAGIERGLDELKTHGRPESTHVILFVTDGIMDMGSAAQNEEKRRWLREQLLPDVRDRGIRIFSIALTEQADIALIQEMARETKGEYYRAISASEISDRFRRIATALRPSIKQQSPITEQPPGAEQPPIRARSPSDLPPDSTSDRPPDGHSWLPWLVGGTILGGGVVLVALFVFWWWKQGASPPIVGPGKTPVEPPRDPEPKLPPPIPADPSQPVPIILVDLQTGKTITFTKPIVRIGRQEDNDLVIPDPENKVGRYHAQIEFKEGLFYIRDLRSVRGTLLNGKKIEGTEPVLLKNGDYLQFGKFRYLFAGSGPLGIETIGPDEGNDGTGQSEDLDVVRKTMKKDPDSLPNEKTR